MIKNYIKNCLYQYKIYAGISFTRIMWHLHKLITNNSFAFHKIYMVWNKTLRWIYVQFIIKFFTPINYTTIIIIRSSQFPTFNYTFIQYMNKNHGIKSNIKDGKRNFYKEKKLNNLIFWVILGNSFISKENRERTKISDFLLTQ